MSAPTLDLHGFTQDEALSAVDAFLMRHQSKTRLRIVTGKGKGVLQKAVAQYLKTAGYPFDYEKGNTGVLLVFGD